MKLLTTDEAAKLLRVSPQFLERDRWAGANVPFIRVGKRAVRYDQDALQEYLKSRTHGSVSALPQAAAA